MSISDIYDIITYFCSHITKPFHLNDCMERPHSTVRRCYCCRQKHAQSTKRLVYIPSDVQTRSTSSISRRTNSPYHTSMTSRDVSDPRQPTVINEYNIRYDKRWTNNVPEFKYNVPSNYTTTFPRGRTTRLQSPPTASQTLPEHHVTKCFQESVVDVGDQVVVEKLFYAAPHISDNQSEIEEKCRRWIETLPSRFSGMNTVISLPALSPGYRQ